MPKRTKAELEKDLAEALEQLDALRAEVHELEAELLAGSGDIERQVREAIQRLEMEGVFDRARAAMAVQLAKVLDSIGPFAEQPAATAPIAKQLDAVMAKLTPSADTGKGELAKIFALNPESQQAASK